MCAPPVLVIPPLTNTELVVIVLVSTCTQRLGGFATGGAIGDATTIASVPAPAEFTALTLNVFEPACKPVNTWLDQLCAGSHGPLL